MRDGVEMVFFKSCPRCAGDRVSESDFYGRFITCLACGHVSYPQAPTLSVVAERLSDRANPALIDAGGRDASARSSGRR